MSPIAQIIGHLTILAATLAGFLFQWLREKRKHDWDREQFRQMRRQLNQNGNGEECSE